MRPLALQSLPVPPLPSRDLLARNRVGPADPFYSFPSHFSPDPLVLLALYLSFLQDAAFSSSFPLLVAVPLPLPLSVIGL